MSTEPFMPLMHYIENLYAAETPAMIKARENIEKHDFPIHISPVEGRLLQILIKTGGYKKIVEIGTLGGYSSLWLAGALPSDGHLFTCEHDEKRVKMAHNTLDKHNNITIVEGDAQNTLPLLHHEKGPFDMVFIDADKKSYLKYLDWAETAIRPGGMIVADDTLLQGAAYLDHLPGRVRASTARTLKEFNRRLADRNKYDSLLWPTDAGLTIARLKET